jgi:hypothetical protein
MYKDIIALLFLSLLVNPINSLGQNSELTKRKLIKILKSSIEQDSKIRIRTNSNPWTICNKDSAYYKSDTLRLYLANSSQYRNHSSCCSFIDWTFYKKNAFVLEKTQICEEPPSTNVNTPDDWYAIEISKDKEDLILTTSNQEKLINKFKVVTITPIITLVRLSL